MYFCPLQVSVAVLTQHTAGLRQQLPRQVVDSSGVGDPQSVWSILFWRECLGSFPKTTPKYTNHNETHTLRCTSLIFNQNIFDSIEQNCVI